MNATCREHAKLLTLQTQILPRLTNFETWFNDCYLPGTRRTSDFATQTLPRLPNFETLTKLKRQAKAVFFFSRAKLTMKFGKLVLKSQH